MPRRHTMLSPILAACFVLASHGLAPAAAEKPVVVTLRLGDFESAAEMATWQVRGAKVPTLWQLSTEHATRGTHAAKLVTRSVKDGAGRWPAVVLPAKAMPTADWSPYRYLVFDAFNPSKSTNPLLVHVNDAKRSRWSKPAPIPPGKHTVRVQLSGPACGTQIREIHLFQSDPTDTHTVFIDDLRLESDDLRGMLNSLRQSYDAATAKVKVAGEALAGAPDRCEAARKQLAALATGLAALAGADPVAPAAASGWLKALDEARAAVRAIEANLSLDLFAARFKGAPWGYGWTHGVAKVFRTDRPFLGTVGGPVKVELAANEYEGAQLVLRSTQPLKNVKVAVGDLVADGGKRLSASQIEVLLVGYVNTRKPPYAVDYVGWWPDPLLDFLPSFDLDANVWQPVWLDVHATPDQAPGLYRGTATASADGVAPLEVPIEVTVWPFAVPTEYHFPLAVVFWDHTLQSLYSKDAAEWKKYEAYCRGAAELADLGSGEARRLADIRRKCHDLILAHHLIPDRIYRNHPPRIDDVKRWRAAGARWFNILHVPSIGSLKKGQPYPAASRKRILDILADYVPKLKKAGLLDMAYVYGFDEIRENQFAAVKDIFGEIKRRYPTIPLMTTAYDQSFGTKTGLDGVVDIWVPLTPVFGKRQKEIAAARRRGRQVWWYICCGPRHPYANWFVEYTAAEHRLVMGLMPWKFHSEGFLHYSMNLWRTYRDAKTKDGKTVRRSTHFTEPIDRGPLTNSDGKAWHDFNGDGQIFYPGPDGPLSTIRMKCIRDGLEDYEYLWLLKQAVTQMNIQGAPIDRAWMARAQAALAVPDSVVRTLTDYTTDGARVLAARRAIAELLASSRP
ncbi:DUF4091 domain-containing protein [bacterium]|nr:DUF4091 domain-containing protein [bacterium]